MIVDKKIDGFVDKPTIITKFAEFIYPTPKPTIK